MPREFLLGESEHLGLAIKELAQQQGIEHAVLAREAREGDQHAAQTRARLAGAGGGVDEGAEEILVGFVHDPPHEGLARLEVVVEHADVDAGPAGDLADREAREAGGRQHGPRGGDELAVEVAGGAGHN